MPIIGGKGYVVDNTKSRIRLKVSGREMASFLEAVIKFDRTADKSDCKTGDFQRVALNPVCLEISKFLKCRFACFIAEKKHIHPDLGFGLGLLIGRQVNPVKFKGGEKILYSTHGCSGVAPAIYLVEGFDVAYSREGSIGQSIYNFMSNRKDVPFADIEEHVLIPDFCMKEEHITKLTPEQQKDLDEAMQVAFG